MVLQHGSNAETPAADRRAFSCGRVSSVERVFDEETLKAR
jgi:hypothetical protein